MTTSEPWRSALRSDPVPWLLEPGDPAVRHATLVSLLERPASDPEVVEARAAAMAAGPIASILEHQSPGGWWGKPGAGSGPKYRGTTWQLTFLHQLMADPADPRIQRACEYVLSHAQASSGGFGASAAKSESPPPPSSALHCLNGNLVEALIGFGWLGDPRLQAAIDWHADVVTGEHEPAYFRSGTSGPNFACAANEKKPCAWGAVRAMLALGAVPPARRSATVQRAIDMGREFLLGVDPATAGYPRPSYAPRPNGSWFKFGFPSAYVTDVLRTCEAMVAIGAAHDPRLRSAIEFVLSKQDAAGRWRNEYAYNGKGWLDIEPQGQPSKWVTLRACRVLKAST